MTKCKCWVAVLIAVLLLPNAAVSADLAKDSYEKGKACLDKRDYDAAITAFTEALRLDPKNVTTTLRTCWRPCSPTPKTNRSAGGFSKNRWIMRQ